MKRGLVCPWLNKCIIRMNTYIKNIEEITWIKKYITHFQSPL